MINYLFLIHYHENKLKWVQDQQNTVRKYHVDTTISKLLICAKIVYVDMNEVGRNIIGKKRPEKLDNLYMNMTKQRHKITA